MTTLFPELPGQSTPRSGRPGRPRSIRLSDCLVCGRAFAKRFGVPTCSRSCGGKLSAWKRLRPGEPFDREAMAVISAARRQRRTVRCRERRLRHAATWDGITDEEILNRDGWRCQLPECLYRSRKINRRYKYPDPRSPGIDHIVPLSLGGDDTAVNKRATHHGCNMARGNRMGDEQLPLIGSLREPPLMTEIAGTVRERRPPKPKPVKVLWERQCSCGRKFTRQGGKGKDCPDCLADLAKRSLALRRQGYLWKEVAAAVGRASPGSLITLVQRYCGDEQAA